MKSNNEQNTSVFWLSYASLMAGLLFIFIFIIGVIVVKYMASQNIFTSKDQSIVEALAGLEIGQGRDLTPEKLNNILKNEIIKLDTSNLELKKSNDDFNIKLNLLQKKVDELLKSQAETNKTISNLSSENSELARANNILKTRVLVLDDENRELSEISDRDKKIVSFRADLDQAKSYIKNLSAAKARTIKALSDNIGKNIDPVTGTLTLHSATLFDKNKTELKKEAMNELKDTLTKYFDILLSDGEISKNIDQIMIEGFTDSDGGYLYNLELSQRRAYEVMRFIKSEDKRLNSLLDASGQSYNDVILVNGVEDKDASRRIEIKFSLSNKEAMDKIEQLLEIK